MTYHAACGPDRYPEEDGANFGDEVAAIRLRLVRLMETATTAAEVTWLRMAIVVLDEAHGVHEVDKAKCRKKIRDVAGLLDDAASGRSIDPTMVVDSKGGVSVIKH